MNLRTNHPIDTLPIGMRLLPCPRSWATEALLTALFMCLPLGIAAMVYASKVEPRYATGRYDEAAEASSRARNLVLWGVRFGAVMWIAILWLCLTGSLHSSLLTLTI